MENKGSEIQECFGKQLMSHNNFRMVVDLSYCVIIKECDKWQPDEDRNNYPEHKDSLLSLLNDNVHWAQHGFINALQSHVQIIYAYQEAVIKSQKQKEFMICPNNEEAMLIIRALNMYQEWKDRIVNNGYILHGKGWGDDLGFNSAKWNEHNKEFMELYKRV